jgi:hypothetical protein
MEVSESDTLEVIADRIEAVVPDTLTRELIERTVRQVWDELEQDATCTTFLPLLTERIARERLRTGLRNVARGRLPSHAHAAVELDPEPLRHTA